MEGDPTRFVSPAILGALLEAPEAPPAGDEHSAASLTRELASLVESGVFPKHRIKDPLFVGVLRCLKKHLAGPDPEPDRVVRNLRWLFGLDGEGESE